MKQLVITDRCICSSKLYTRENKLTCKTLFPVLTQQVFTDSKETSREALRVQPLLSLHCDGHSLYIAV